MSDFMRELLYRHEIYIRPIQYLKAETFWELSNTETSLECVKEPQIRKIIHL